MAVAAFPVALQVGGTVAGVAFNCLDLIIKIEEWISAARENEDTIEDIQSNVHTIHAILNDLSRAKQHSDSVKMAYYNLLKKLQKCEEYVDTLKDRKLSLKIQSKSIKEDLVRLKTAVNEALHLLNTAVTVQGVLHAQNVTFPSILEELGNLPSRPTSPKITKRAEKRVLMTWEKPETNPMAVEYYQVQFRKRWQKKWENCDRVPSTELEYIITGLSNDTKYWFRVRGVTAKDYQSLTSEEIMAETKLSAVARGFASAGAFFAGTVTAPVVTPVAAHVASGNAIDEHDFSKKGAAAVRAGTVAATPLLVVAGTIGAPLVGGAWAAVANDTLKPDEF